MHDGGQLILFQIYFFSNFYFFKKIFEIGFLHVIVSAALDLAL